MQTLAVQKFNGNEFSFWGENKEIFVTIDDLVKGFGYKNKHSFEVLLNRNKKLLDPKFSRIVSVPHGAWCADIRKQGQRKTYETRVFNRRGIFEIGAISKTAKAEEFRDWVFNYIETLEKQLLKSAIKQTETLDLAKQLSKAVQNSDWYKSGSKARQANAYTNIHRLLCKLSAPSGATHKAEMLPCEFEIYEKLAVDCIYLLNHGRDYENIKEQLNKTAVIYRKKAQREYEIEPPYQR